MFNITESIQFYWDKKNKPKASTEEIKRIEVEFNIALPVPYIEFITQFGFVLFGRDAEKKKNFEYSIIYPDRQEIHQGDIAFLRQTSRVISCYHNMTQELIEDGLPAIPKNYLPVGSDAGQGQILLKMDGEDAGSVWYWPYNEWAWGTETNAWLGFVAKDFYEFINKLRPYE